MATLSRIPRSLLHVQVVDLLFVFLYLFSLHHVQENRWRNMFLPWICADLTWGACFEDLTSTSSCKCETVANAIPGSKPRWRKTSLRFVQAASCALLATRFRVDILSCRKSKLVLPEFIEGWQKQFHKDPRSIDTCVQCSAGP